MHAAGTDSSIFDRLNAEPWNSLIESAIEKGGIPVGYTCSMAPVPLLSVPPLFPLRMRAPGAAGTEVADIYLSNLTCSYTRSILEFTMDFRYEFIRGWVHAASCDHLRRLHDNMDYAVKPEFSHIVDIPHRSGPEALKWYVEELYELKNRLESHFNIVISEEAVEHAIEKRNSFNRLLRSIGELRKKERPPLTGTDFHRILTAAGAAPQGLIEEEINNYLESLRKTESNREYRARLMLAGGHMDDPDYIKTIESTGAIVAADRICTGSVPGLVPVEITGPPLESIARHTLETPSCPRMMEDFDRRLEQIIKTSDEYKIDGIIIEIIKFCDTWGVESAALVSALRKKGIKVLFLEREYRGTGESQLQTRVQAFLESMAK